MLGSPKANFGARYKSGCPLEATNSGAVRNTGRAASFLIQCKYIWLVPFYQLLTILTYKAVLLSKQVITVCPSYTSQIDHRTGLKDGIRQGCRYIGKDGFIQHADINAAMNIANRSKRPISQCLKPLTYGQAVVNQPIVGKIVPTGQPALDLCASTNLAVGN